jgi:hypothetical protein
MPDSRIPKRNLSSPDDFPIPPPQQPPIDLSSIQRELGRLSEAVDTLKEQSKAQSIKLDAVSVVVAGAKAAGRLLWVAVGFVGSVLLLLIAAYLHHLFEGGTK